MTKIAYFDCQCGAAGDMILAAMIDAGLNKELLKEQISSLGLEELEDIKIEEVLKNGIRAVKMTPIIKSAMAHHHHHEHKNDHDHGHSHSHTHSHAHKHSHGAGTHEHRHLKKIIEIINTSSISKAAKNNAISIFKLIAEVEAKIHGKTAKEVHFHEVGATDSIVDIVGCCIGFDYFKFDTVYCSSIALGGGAVKCAHGIVPVPAPATAELIKGLPVKDGPVETELLTPTGAAVLRHFVDKFKPMPTAMPISSGYGSGTKDFEGVSNILRLRIAETTCEDSEADVWQVETNIDDCSPEIIAMATEKLIENSLDVWTTPIFMKKNRPGVTLSVLCEDRRLHNVEDIIFNMGLTLGLRKTKMERRILERRFTSRKTPWGELEMKEGFYNGKKVFSKAEFESVKKLAQENGLSITQINSALYKE